MDVTLAVIGFACLIAAVVGGGVKLAGSEIPQLESVRRQALLAVVGVAVLVAAVVVARNRPDTPATPQAGAPTAAGTAAEPAPGTAAATSGPSGTTGNPPPPTAGAPAPSECGAAPAPIPPPTLPASPADQPAVAVSPDCGHYAGRAVVAGRGYAPGEQVRLGMVNVVTLCGSSIAEAVIQDVRADPRGAFGPVEIVLPREIVGGSRPGSYYFCANGLRSDREAYQPYRMG